MYLEWLRLSWLQNHDVPGKQVKVDKLGRRFTSTAYLLKFYYLRLQPLDVYFFELFLLFWIVESDIFSSASPLFYLAPWLPYFFNTANLKLMEIAHF